MRRTLTAVALLLLCFRTGSAQLVWDHAASFAPPGYLAIPSSPALQFAGSLSLECWVNPVNVSSPRDQTLLCKHTSAGSGFDLTLRDGHIFFEIGGTPRLYGKTAIPNGVWTHVAVVYDSSAKILASYVNGNMDSLRSGLSDPIRPNTDSLIVGRLQNYPTTTQFTGVLDEIRVWNRPLSADEIQRNRYISLASVSGPYMGVVLSLPFQFLAQAPNPYAPQDFSGNALPVSVRGKVSGVRVATGPSKKLVPNEAVYFDGGGYLSTPSSGANNFSASHTLQCWVWPDTVQRGTILQKREGSHVTGYSVYLWDNRVSYRINTTTMLMSRRPIPSREWTHVAAVYNDTTGTALLYLNGALDTATAGAAAPIASTDSVFVGTGFNGPFRGYVDNVVLSSGVWAGTLIATWLAAGLDLWNKTPDMPGTCVYTFDGSLLSMVIADARMRFNGTARFSHPAFYRGVPTSPLLRADEIGYPRGFRLRASDRRIPAAATQGDMVEDSLVVSEDVIITNLRLALTLGHTMTSDLTVTLVGPAGDLAAVFKRGQLLQPVSNINTIYDDGADSAAAYNTSLSWLPRVKPESPLLAAFGGKRSQGIWRLRVNDQAGGDVGRLYVWGLQFNDQLLVGVLPGPEGDLPGTPTLWQNYPNPFNVNTEIRYRVLGFDQVHIAVFDLLGREVATLVDERKAPGEYTLHFDAGRLASGTYLYRLKAGNYMETKRMLLLK